MGALWCGKSPEKCLKLLNSGDILKLLVPNDGLKAMCGWETTYSLAMGGGNKFNHSCKVISQMMTEREIDYRGSKSIIAVCPIHTFVIIVKEQRIDGSWRKKYNTLAPRCFFRLRFILVGFERNYQIKNLSKLINMYRSYTSKAVVPECKGNLYNVQQKINPWFFDWIYWWWRLFFNQYF